MARKPPVKPGDPAIRRIDYTVNNDGCWVWNWSVQPKGYAQVRVNGRSRKAHRVMYEEVYGPIPDSHVIRHVCDNPSCVNPGHLRAGTPTENARDMVKAGNQHNQKFKEGEVKEIRRVFGEGGITQAELARQHGVTSGAVGQIIRNKTFYDETYTPPPLAKGRPKGSLRRALNEDLANEIRRLYLAGGVSQRALAEQFQLNEAIISGVVGNRLYPDPDYTRPVRRACSQKIDRTAVDEIKLRLESGASQHQVAEEFGVSQPWIRKIATGRTHHGKPRKYARKQHAESKPRPTLQSINGPAPTGKVEQQRRQNDLRDPERKPRRKPGAPLITEDDWTLDPETGCHAWRWGNTGRPQITLEDGHSSLAYRVVWKKNNGPIPRGYQINHQCNNGYCINLAHLYLGDQFDNMRDTVTFGNHATQKLSRATARAIRDEYEPRGITYEELGDKHGVSLQTIYKIIINQTFHDPDYTPRNPTVSVRRKLSESDANVIRERYRYERITQSALGREFGVSHGVIGRIIRNEGYYDPAYTPPPDDEKRLWKLSNADKKTIISEYRSGATTTKQLAETFEVGRSQIKTVLKSGSEGS